MSSQTALNYTNLKNLYNLVTTPPTKTTDIIDQFSVISSTNNTSGDDFVSTYAVQDLVPNIAYTLKFKLFKSTTTDSGGTVWTNVLGSDNFLNPASVFGLSDNTTTPDGGGYYWSQLGSGRQLQFKTTKNDPSTIIGEQFGAVRQGIDYNVPSGSARYADFVGPKSFSLGLNGKPPNGGFENDVAISHAYDGYLFIFEKTTSTTLDLNDHLTKRFTGFDQAPPDFIGYNAADNTKGYHRIPEIQAAQRFGGVNNKIEVGFTENMFTNSDGKFYQPGGGGLDRDKEYYAAIMLHNKNANYIVKTDKEDANTIGRVIKWVVSDIPVGGVWSITIGSWTTVNDAVSGQLSSATSVAVSVDSIGIQGSILDADNFRMIITAEPV
jgi:hypothetical protein